MKQSIRGFSLLEVLVAFVILALVLGVIMEIFSGGLRNVSRAGEFQQAVLLGQSKLATVSIETPLVEGESSGEFGAPDATKATYRWQLSIRPYRDQQMEQVGSPAAVLPVALLEVDIKVSWGTTDPPHAISLKTLRLANKAGV